MAWKVGASFMGGAAAGVGYLRMAQLNHQECHRLENELAKAKHNYFKAEDEIYKVGKLSTDDARELRDIHEYGIKRLEKEQDRKCNRVFTQFYSLIPKEW